MKIENDLGRDDIRRLVLRLAIPSMLAQFINVLYSVVDRIYIGNIPVIGETALAMMIRFAIPSFRIFSAASYVLLSIDSGRTMVFLSAFCSFLNLVNKCHGYKTPFISVCLLLLTLYTSCLLYTRAIFKFLIN